MPPQPTNLLLCLDAFGTLFKPRLPITQQYGDVARAYGLGGSFTNEDVGKAFKKAFKEESKQNPNYGKSKGLGAEIWWTNVIKNTFTPLSTTQPLPTGMVHTLLHRFRCDEGYTLFGDVRPLITKLRRGEELQHPKTKTKVVIGVITNSDDRVPEVLSSLGFRVSPVRYGSSWGVAKGEEGYDFDFAVMSYDVGYEKPDVRIFRAAEEVLGWLVEEGGTRQWRKVYVGDEFDKDVTGALEAGWNAVLIDRETPGERKDLVWLDEKPVGSLYEVFETARAVGFGNLEKLAEWLPSP